jgi:uncharacterized protein YcnI
VAARVAAGLIASLSLLVVTALPVAAHVTIVDGTSVPAGGSAVIYFRLPHGCDGQPVNALSVQLADGVVGAKAEYIAGWTASTTMVPADYELFGTKYTERVGTIRWEGGPLPDDEFLDFGVRATFQLEPGEYTIPVIQECGATTESWIEIPAAGQTEDDLGYPAPTITVVAAHGDGEDDHGAMASASPGAEEPASADMDAIAADLAAAKERITALEAAPVAAPAPESSTATPPWLTIAALAAGLGGLALGIVAVRRRS